MSAAARPEHFVRVCNSRGVNKVAGLFFAVVLAVTSLSGCSSNATTGSAESAEPSTSAEPVGETTTLSLTVETTEPVFLVSETEDAGATCGGNQGGLRIAESSEVIIRTGQTTLVEATASDGKLIETVIRDDFSVESIRCEFTIEIELSAIDVATFDVLFTSGRAVSVEAQMVTLDELTTGLLMTNR